MPVANAGENVAPTDASTISINDGAPEIAVMACSGLCSNKIVAGKFLLEGMELAGREIDASVKHVESFCGKGEPFGRTTSEFKSAFYDGTEIASSIHKREGNRAIIHGVSSVHFLGVPSDFSHDYFRTMGGEKFLAGQTHLASCDTRKNPSENPDEHGSESRDRAAMGLSPNDCIGKCVPKPLHPSLPFVIIFWLLIFGRPHCGMADDEGPMMPLASADRGPKDVVVLAIVVPERTRCNAKWWSWPQFAVEDVRRNRA
jgi:hypothetical protein